MMHILFAVIAIALTCLVTFGGVSYIKTDMPARAVTSRGLVAQYEALMSGVVSYRSVNNGITPDSVEKFEGFLPGGEIPNFGSSDNGYGWTLSKPEGETSPVICLSVTNPTEARYASARQVAVEVERRSAATVSVGDMCGGGVPYAGAAVPGESTDVVFTVRGF